MTNARLIAAQALLRMEKQGAWSNLSLDEQLRRGGLDSTDSAFAGALLYGVTERLITLDACIAAHSRQKPRKLSPAVRCALRIGIYQLLYMDKIPEHAAVNESVELVRTLRSPAASGYVNGVLRSFLRSGKSIPIPESPLSARMSVEYSCPEPLLNQWLDHYGEACVRRFLSDSLGRAPLSVRVNTLRTSPDELSAILESEGIGIRRHPELSSCLLLEHTGSVRDLSAFKRGLFHVQDPASQICAMSLDTAPGHLVLDACAAPGGKTFTLAQIMRGKGKIIACDLHESRTALIQNRAMEMGFENIDAKTLDMSLKHEELPLFDRVLCDVPCSGYGSIRRKPEIKYKPIKDFTDIPNIQYKILENSAQYCKDGGELIYSTCTLNPAENQHVVQRFLREHPNFSPRPLGGILGNASEITILGEHMSDGFYLAALVSAGK